MASPRRSALCAAAVAALLCIVSVADAGRYNQGKANKVPKVRHWGNHVAAPLRKKHELPKEFNWCDLDGVNYCAPNWNQHIPQYCGSCFLHGSTSMIQDRLKIMKKGKSPDVMLGRQTFLNCAPLEGYSEGCNGGDTFDVFGYMSEFGLPDEGCLPYNASDHTKWPDAKHCPPEGQCMNCMPIDGEDTCWPIERYIRYYLTAWGHIEEKGAEAMMSEIFHRGPITCGMACPEDFTWHYKGGVYVDKSHDTELDHDVEVVGWGDEDGVPYWIVRNSWGAYWGEMGFFRVEMGKNYLQLESGDCWYAEPEWRMEQDIHAGKLHGSMYGLRTKNEPDGPEAGSSSGAVSSSGSSSGSGLKSLAELAEEITTAAFGDKYKLQPQQQQQAEDEVGAEVEVLRAAEGGEGRGEVSRRMLQ